MASGIALPLANTLLGITNIGTSIGYTVHEKKLVDELKEKAEKLQKDINEASELYENVFCFVTVNLDRWRKAVDSLPSEFLEMIQGDIDPQFKTQNSITVLGLVLGHGVRTFGAYAGMNRFMGGLTELVKYLRSRPPGASQDTESNVWGDHEMTPLLDADDGLSPEQSTIAKTPKFDKLIKGLNVARVIFGIAGLSAIVAIGKWTADQLEKAKADIEEKQNQVSAFQKGMEKVLDDIIKSSGLPEKNGYNELKKLAGKWKELSRQFESYQTRLYYAIKGYFMHKPLDNVKEVVEQHTDASDKPFPIQCYNLARQLADEIRVYFDEGKTDKEIVGLFSSKNTVLNRRFVFSDYFIANLRESYDL